ncbi:MAG: hypothetical protein ACPGVG_05330, partial [Mycobacterium sp.]
MEAMKKLGEGDAEVAREFISDIGLDASWADHEVTHLAALLARVRAEGVARGREEEAQRCANDCV